MHDHLMTLLQAAVWQFLVAHFAGPEKATPRSTIIARNNIWHDGRFQITDRNFRQVVADLVTCFKKPICTSAASGYYVARTARELDAAVRDLRSRIGATAERLRALEVAVPLQQQGSLPL